MFKGKESWTSHAVEEKILRKKKKERKEMHSQGTWLRIMVPKQVTLGKHVTPLNPSSLI